MESRACLECGGQLYGRPDKKFCSDHCRNAHHNKINGDGGGYIRKVNSILKKNRKILLALNPTGKSKTTHKRLLDKGFNFDYFTSTYTNKAGNTYFFCYEQGYLPLDNGWLALVVKKENMV